MADDVRQIGPSDAEPRAIASDEIYRLLQPWPLAIPIYQQVSAYFGDCLKITQQELGKQHSGVVYPTPFSRTAPVIVSCRIYMNDAAAASLMHELLHLKMISDGFPLTTDARPVRFGEAEFYLSYANKYLSNALQHEIFISDFLSAGFPSDQFFHHQKCLIDPAEEKRKSETDLMRNGIASIRRGLWGVVYLCQRLEQIHGFDNRADELLEAGKDLFPKTMLHDDHWISTWIDRGGFRDSRQYIPSVTQAMDQFGLPYPLFYSLARDQTGILQIVLDESA